MRLDGFGPEFVAFGGEVQEVGHEALGEDAVVVEEGVGDIEVVHPLSAVEFGDDAVDLVVDFALGIFGFFATREDSEEKDLSLGTASTDIGDDAGNALGGLGGVLFGCLLYTSPSPRDRG